MPSIKEFEKKRKTAAVRSAKSDPPNKKKHSRRPGRDTMATVRKTDVREDAVTDDANPQDPKNGQKTEISVEEVASADRPIFTADAYEENEPGVSASTESAGQNETPECDDKFNLNFYGSELLRARVPKAFELVEAVAEDWMKDGRFEALPVGHPFAQMAAQVGLRKAKDLEKKLDEKGVFMFARMGYQYAKSKLNKK